MDEIRDGSKRGVDIVLVLGGGVGEGYLQLGSLS